MCSKGVFSFSTREWGFKSLSFASLGLGTVLIFLQLAQVLGDFRLLLAGGCVLWYWGDFSLGWG